MKSAMLLKRCVVPRSYLMLRFLSSANKPSSEKKEGELHFEKQKTRSSGDFGPTSDDARSFAKAGVKTQGQKIEEGRASDTGFDTSTKRSDNEFTSEPIMGDLRSSQPKKGQALQSQRNFSTIVMLHEFKPTAASVRYLTEDSNRGMDKSYRGIDKSDRDRGMDKGNRGKKDDERTHDDSTQDQQQQKKSSTKSNQSASDNSELGTDSAARQENWRGASKLVNRD
jgi:hypothetical protein